MERRELLKRAGIVGAAGAVFVGTYASTRRDGDDRPVDADESPTRTPTSPPDTEPSEQTATETEPEPTEAVPHAGAFETVVDAVEAGADPSGDEPVNFLFEEYGDDGTLLAFEPGEYRIDYFAVADIDGFGVVGTGPEPATFVPADGDCRGGHPWVFFDAVADLVLENLLFDFRDSASGGPLHLFLQGDSLVRDVAHLGSCSNQLSGLRVGVQDEAGTARFERFEARNVDDNQSLTGVFVGADHAGELTFENCELDGFSDNGLYASAPGGSDGRDGAVNVVGGTYSNNNVSGIRLGSTGSSASDVRIAVDESDIPGWGELNARGIRLRNSSEQVIENCDITFGADAADSFGGIVFHPKNGGGLVTDTTIAIERDNVPAIRAFPTETDGEGAPRFRNVSVTGGAADGVAVEMVGRDGAVFENCTIQQPGSGRNGLRFRASEDCRIVDSHIDVTGVPLSVSDGSVEIEDSTVVTPGGEREIDSATVEDGPLTFD